MTKSTIESGEFARELEVAGRLAKAAGAIAMRYRGGELDVEDKPDDEGPVTIADKEASELVVAGLGGAFPDDVIISEENPDDPRRLSAKRVWYIDPIDGTKDYIRGEDGFCVMIGLAVDHRPAVGVVFHPPTGDMFVAAPGSGAWVLPQARDPRVLSVSATTSLSDVRLVASRSHRTAKMDEVKSVLGISDELNIGSIGLKLAIIAAGDRDLYVNPSSRCSSWDTCGPEAILAEAGGRLSDLSGAPLSYQESATGHRNGLVASNGVLHDAAVERLGTLFPGRSD